MITTEIAVSMKKLSLLLVGMLPLFVWSQRAITLDECFDLAAGNHPLSRESVLMDNQSRLDMDAIQKGKLPRLALNARATYQSDVTSLPIQLPNVSVEPPNNDQYRATLDVDQVIYNGGVIDAKARVKEAASRVGQQEVAVNLYKLKNEITQLYLSVLLLQENRDLLEAKEKQLHSRLQEVRAGVKYGVLLSSSADALEVELLRIRQSYSELNHTESGLLKQLSLLIGQELDRAVVFRQPEVFTGANRNSQRPELMLFELQKNQVQLSGEILSRSRMPRLVAFAQGGYGNPGLNMLDNSFSPFYMAGLRLNWDIFDWNKVNTEKQSLQIHGEIIDAQKDSFEMSTNLELAAIQSEIAKIAEMISYDEAIIPLREKMVKTAESQLRNGVITSSAFITEFTNLFEARNQLALHRTQLLMRQIQYQLTEGTYGARKN